MTRLERNAAIALAMAASIAIGGCIGERVGGPGVADAQPDAGAVTGSDVPSSSPGPTASASAEPAPSRPMR